MHAWLWLLKPLLASSTTDFLAILNTRASKQGKRTTSNRFLSSYNPPHHLAVAAVAAAAALGSKQL